jgi:tetratricopeptide (TPR) repeat protein
MIKVVFSKQADHDIDLVPFWYHWYKNIFHADIIIVTPIKLSSSSIQQVTDFYRDKDVIIHPVEMEQWDARTIWSIQRDIVSRYTRYMLDYIAISADTDQFFEPPDLLEIKDQLVVYERIDLMTDQTPDLPTVHDMNCSVFLPDTKSVLVPKKDFTAAFVNRLHHKDVFLTGHYIGPLKRISNQNINLQEFHIRLRGVKKFIEKIEALTFDNLSGAVSSHFKKWVRILKQDGKKGLTHEYLRLLNDSHANLSMVTDKFKALAKQTFIPRQFKWYQVSKELLEAQQWAHDNHLKKAGEKLSGILEIVPFHCFVLLELGRIAWAGKDAISAEKYFNQALDANPFNIDTIKALGLLLLATNQTVPAIEQFEKGLKIDNKDPELWQWLGKCYMESNDFDKARLAYERSINYASA